MFEDFWRLLADVLRCFHLFSLRSRSPAVSEVFTQTWINRSMDRAAAMVSQELFTETAMWELFKLLLTPELTGHGGHSCLPRRLRGARPPRGCVRSCVQELLERWSSNEAAAHGALRPKRRR